MSPLGSALVDYLAVRRALGYRLDESGRQLASFVAHLDAEAVATVTVAAAIDWASSTPNGASRSRRSTTRSSHPSSPSWMRARPSSIR